MEIRIAALVPADELDAQLVGGIGGRMNSSSSMPRRWISPTKGGTVDSPTPMVPSSSDSTSSISQSSRFRCWHSMAAASHPEVPPPTITIFAKGPHHQFRFSTITPGASWDRAVL